MGQVLHGSARTTSAIRAAIQRSQESLQALAVRHGINPETVAKWRKRTTVTDAAMGPTPASTVLTVEQEAIAVAFRQHTLLPLDDCLYALQATIPHLSRSALHRCFQRHGISRLPLNEDGQSPPKKKFKDYPIGYLHVDFAEVYTEEGKQYLFVAIDRTSKVAFAELYPLSLAFVEAAIEAGYAPNDDFNDSEQTGFGLYQVTQKNGLRCSAAGDYLHPALARENLTAITHAHVTELLIEHGRCVGVAYVHDGQALQVRARREVILSGGSINSPQVLLLSGIGPAEHLRQYGIPVKLDLPGVGQNLQDHMFVPVAYHCTQPISLADATSPEQGARFQNEQMGMLTSNIGEAGGFIDLGIDGSPEIQFHFGPSWFIHHGAGNPAGHGYTLLPGMVRPHSTGTVTLNSADPFDKALVDPNYYGDPHDMELMKQSVAAALVIAEQPAFAPYRGERYLPGPDVMTPEALENFIRDYTMTIYHPVGTCKMGHDELAVVDDSLRIHGIAGLRVADASIMPIIINGNSNIPTMVIGEKCADMILQELDAAALVKNLAMTGAAAAE